MRLPLNIEQVKDIERLIVMLRYYCDQVHIEEKTQFEMPSYPASTRGIIICKECQNFLRHAIVKRFLCSEKPKPMCHECTIHCYSPKYRELATEVMSYWVRHSQAVSRVHII